MKRYSKLIKAVKDGKAKNAHPTYESSNRSADWSVIIDGQHVDFHNGRVVFVDWSFVNDDQNAIVAGLFFRPHRLLRALRKQGLVNPSDHHG